MFFKTFSISHASISSLSLTSFLLIPFNRIVVPVTTYKISVYTADVPDADTRSNVYIKLFGEYGNSEQLALRQSETKRKKFLPGQVDVFTFRDQPWLGKLSKIRIWHDNDGSNPAWYLSSIYVLDDIAAKVYGFVIDSWLSKEHGAVLKESPCSAMTLFKELCKFCYISAVNLSYSLFSVVL